MTDTEAIRMLAALAQEHRLRIFRCLVRTGPEGLASSDIAHAVGIGPTSASFHLKELTSAGLLVARRSGRFVRYALEAAAMRLLLAHLSEDCCGGRPELCAAVDQSSRGLTGAGT